MKINTATAGLALATTLLLLALLDPPLLALRLPASVMILVDDSLSMDRRDLDRAWTGLAEIVPAHENVRVIRFGANAVTESSQEGGPPLLSGPLPRRAVLDGSASHLHEALEMALNDRDAAVPGVALILSDGRVDRRAETWLQRAADLGVPMYWQRVAGRRPDAWISAFLVPQHARVGQILDAVAVLTTSRPELPVTLSWQLDGVTVQRHSAILNAEQVNQVRWRDVPQQAGVRHLQLEIHNEQGQLLHRRDAGINIAGPPDVLLVSNNRDTADLAAALADSAGRVTISTAANMEAALAALRGSVVVVLDDLPLSAAPVGAWRRLVAQLDEPGAGLLALGGDHSFVAGAYRGSLLETRLPVISEAPDLRAGAAVVFVIDASGSMDTTGAAISRYERAREAVATTAAALLPGDRLGLVSFDSEAEVRLPLGPQARPADAIERVWRARPSGGTVLAPALGLGCRLLRDSDAKLRVLVLLTDGFVAGSDTDTAADCLSEAGTRLIAMTVGGGADSAMLRGLAADSTVLDVSDAATLPQQMLAALAAQRSTRRAAPVRVSGGGNELHGFKTAAWPALDAFTPTRVRDEATVLLSSDHGDALVATMNLAGGRSVALPAGLAGWRDWARLTELLGRLVALSIGPAAVDGMYARLTSSGDATADGDTVLQLDFTSMENTGAPSGTLRDPQGGERPLPWALVAPGRYRAPVAGLAAGLYIARIEAGRDQLLFGFTPDHTGETSPYSGTVPVLAERWLDRGLLTEVASDSRPAALASPRVPVSLRAWYTACALATLLILLVAAYRLALTDRLTPLLAAINRRFREQPGRSSSR